MAQSLPLLKRAGLDQRILTTRALDDEPTWELSGVAVSRFNYFYPEWPLSDERRRLYDRCGGNLVSPALARRLYHLRDLALVHCHTGNRLGAQCLRVARRRRVPFVMTLHGGHFAVPRAERDRWGTSERGAQREWTLPWGRVLSLLWDTKHLLEQADAVVCVGIEEYEAARRHLRRTRVVFLPGGVDPDAFAKGRGDEGRRLLDVPDDAPVIVCVGRLDPQKDQETLVRSWLELDDPRCYLALVGPETFPGYADRCRRLAAPRSSRFRVIHDLPTTAVPDVLAAAWIAVVPSRHEPFGLSCLEAWAAGTCLVAADVGGPGWLLKDESAGRLFSPGDSAALATVLRELLADDVRRRALEKEGLRRAREEFTWEQHADGILNLYRSLGVHWIKPLAMSPAPRNRDLCPS